MNWPIYLHDSWIEIYSNNNIILNFSSGFSTLLLNSVVRFLFIYLFTYFND